MSCWKPENKHLAQPIAWRGDYVYCHECKVWTIPPVSYGELIK